MALPIVLAALLSTAEAAAVQETQPEAVVPSAALLAEWDRSTRKMADDLGRRRTITKSGPAMPKSVRNIDPRRNPWVRLTEQEVRRRNRRYPTDQYYNKARYSLTASVDYDRDGHTDLAEMVENSSQGAIRVTYGGPKKRPPSIIFKGSRWYDQEILASGRHRIYLNKPDLGFTVFFRGKGSDRAFYLGE